MSKLKLSSVRNKRKMKALGLPQPDPKLSQSQYAKLQKTWYDKLSAEGFKDIEWVDHKSGHGHNSDFLRGSLAWGKRYHAGRDIYFRLATNYLHHCKSLRGVDKFIWKMHANGSTYEEILAAGNKQYKNFGSLYTLFYEIKKLAARCIAWNKRYPEGLLYKWEEDNRAQEELEDYLKQDYDWMFASVPKPGDEE